MDTLNLRRSTYRPNSTLPFTTEMMDAAAVFFKIPVQKEDAVAVHSSPAPRPSTTRHDEANTYWICPATATRLDGVRAMPLPAMDHIFSQFSSTTVVPGIIDQQRFKLAVSKTLVLYPHMGARLEKDIVSEQASQWQFSLKHTPIPITFRTSNLSNLSSLSSPSLNTPHPSLIDPLPWLSTPPPPSTLSTSPLAKWTITHLPNLSKSVITFHACRVLGDTPFLSRVNQTVSDYYQGRSRVTNAPIAYDGFFDCTKTWSEHARRLRQFEIDQVISAGLGQVVTAYSERELVRQHNLETTITEPVAFSLARSDLEQLRRIIVPREESADRTTQKISETDALCAYLIRLLDEVSGDTCTRAVFLAPLTFVPTCPSSNTTLPLISPPFSPSTSVVTLASHVHHTLAPSPLTSSLHTHYTLPAYTSLLTSISNSNSNSHPHSSHTHTHTHTPPLTPLISPPRGWLGIDVTQLSCADVLRDTSFGFTDGAETYVLPSVTERGFVKVVPTMDGGVRIEARVEREKGVREAIERRVRSDRAESFRRLGGGGKSSATVHARL